MNSTALNYFAGLLVVSGLLYFAGFMLRGPSVSPFNAMAFETWIQESNFRTSWLFLVGGSLFEMLSLVAIFVFLQEKINPSMVGVAVLITFIGKGSSMLLQGQAILYPSAFPEIVKSAGSYREIRMVLLFAFSWMVGTVLVGGILTYAVPSWWWVTIPYAFHVILLNQGSKAFAIEYSGALVMIASGVGILILNKLQIMGSY
jgi:hypothetical protein